MISERNRMKIIPAHISAILINRISKLTKILYAIRARIIICNMLICLAASLMLSSAYADTLTRKERSNLPIIIKSNDLSADNKGRTAIFTGKVVSKQGDITIYSDKLTIYYGDKKEDVEKIEADGNVRIVQENRTGVSAHAVYESKLGRITLTGGNPKVMQGTDTVTGKIIVYFVDEDKSVVSGGGDSRVEAVIHPQPRKGNASTR